MEEASDLSSDRILNELIKLIFQEFLQKKSTRDRVLRTLYSKFISVNYVLKLYFESVQ